LDLKGTFVFSRWPMALGHRWRSIYSPHLKRAIGKSFYQTGLVRWGHWISLVELFESRSGSDLAGPPDKSGEVSLEAGLGPDMSDQPDKSVGVLW
jgi:hypothetical protein